MQRVLRGLSAKRRQTSDIAGYIDRSRFAKIYACRCPSGSAREAAVREVRSRHRLPEEVPGRICKLAGERGGSFRSPGVSFGIFIKAPLIDWRVAFSSLNCRPERQACFPYLLPIFYPRGELSLDFARLLAL